MLTNVWFEKDYQTFMLVVSKDIFDDISSKRIVNQMDKGKFEVHFFKTFSDVKDCLESLS